MLLAWQLLLRGDFNPEGSTTDERTALRRWIAAVAYNAARVHRRKMPPRCEVYEDAIGEPDLAGRIESREILKLAFARLNRVETTLMRGVAEGMTLDELGAQTRMPAGTVATKIRAVRRVLRQRGPR
jgi:DNA-directed RNA polymerase specialized sigma24 family protein